MAWQRMAAATACIAHTHANGSPISLSHCEAFVSTLSISLSQHSFDATLAYLAALWTRDGSVTVTQYPMRKVAQMARLA
jgi:hypothetical protein